MTLIYHDWSGNESNIWSLHLKKFKADRISVNIKRVLAGVGIAFLLSCIARIIEMTVCSNISVPANQSNVSGYFVDYPILAVIMSVIMGPFTEELIYRGILFRFSANMENCVQYWWQDFCLEQCICFLHLETQIYYYFYVNG